MVTQKARESVVLVLVVVLVLALSLSGQLVKSVLALEDTVQATDETQTDADRTKVLDGLKSQGSEASILAAMEYLEANPEDADVLGMLGEVYLNKNNVPGAELVIKKAAALKPEDPFITKLLARLYTSKASLDPANFVLAVEQMNKALAANPKDTSLLDDQIRLYVAGAKTYMAQNNIKKANEAIDMAISLSGNADKSELLAMKELINRPAPAKPAKPAVKK